MSWNKRADDYAGRHHTYEHMTQQENDLIYRGIVIGARWQREQLLSDESVERVASTLADVTGEPRTGRFERIMARAAIMSVVEDGDEDE